MSLTQLTRREVEIAKLLYQGLSAKEIAQQLNITYYTVKAHKYWIYKKLGVKGQKQMLKFYGLGDLAA